MMQTTLRVAVSLFLLSSALASYHSSTKLRRDGILNLYPFPRVGRASRNTWQVPLNDYSLEYEPVEKRQLYAFPRVGRSESLPVPASARRALDQAGMWFGPRVGRSDPSLRDTMHHFLPMPARRTDQTGMWFGPRLGRSFKSDDDADNTIQNELNDRSEPEQTEPTHEEREIRQV